MLHGLLRLRVSRFGLSVCFVAMLLAQIGCMDLAATGLLGVIAVTLTLLRFRRTLLHIVLAEMKRLAALLGRDSAVTIAGVIGLDGAEIRHGKILPCRAGAHQRPLMRGLRGEMERREDNWPSGPSITTGSWV